MSSEELPYRFVFLAHAPELINYVREFLKTETDEVHFEVVDFRSAVTRARACLADGAEVVLCHGGTGNAILQEIGELAVPIARTDMDVIKALKRAAQLSQDIAFAAYEGEVHDVEEMENLLNLRVHLVYYDSYATMRSGISEVFNRGVRVLVGGGVSSRCMEELGGKGFVIEPSLHSIRIAFMRARAIARRNRQEKIHIDDLTAIFKQVREGVICLDERRGVVAVNELAYRLLHLDRQAPLSQLERFYSILQLDAVLTDRQPRREELVHVDGEPLLVNTLPINMHGGNNGAIALFEDIPSLQKISRKIGEKLYAKGFVAKTSLDDLKGQARCMQQLKKTIRRFSKTDASIFIHGETGTGKELVAHALHMESDRADGPFVAVNVAALAPTLLESELFGYEEGAFTGARRGGRPGLFEMAHHGTLSLDEIGEMGQEAQLRLLRVLESREVMRVGGSRLIPVNVRLVSASHRSLTELVAQGVFRADLYYRLTTLKLQVPPLRERTEDIPLIIQHLLSVHGMDARVFSPEMVDQMKQYPWPGNIRELLATIESYLIMLERPQPDPRLFRRLLSENDFAINHQDGRFPSFDPSFDLKGNLNKAKTWYIREAIRHCADDRRHAARLLGISYATLWRAVGAEEKEQGGFFHDNS